MDLLGQENQIPNHIPMNHNATITARIQCIPEGGGIPQDSKFHAQNLEQFLTDNGCIGKRKPTAVTSGAKNSYVRDEMKLWNKLGFLYKRSNTDYFFPNEGYKFNWERITEVLRNNT